MIKNLKKYKRQVEKEGKLDVLKEQGLTSIAY